MAAGYDGTRRRVKAALHAAIQVTTTRGDRIKVRADMAVVEQQQEQEPSRRKGQAWPTGQHQQLQGAVGNRQRALAAAPRAAAPGACSKAFRPPGQAPPPQHLNRQRQSAKPPVPRPMPVRDQLAALRQENAEMREHLSALLSHFKQQLDSAAAASAAASASDMHLRPAHLALRSLRRQPAVHHVAGLGGPIQQEPGSPGRTTAVVLSPRAGGADLAVAVFEVRHLRDASGLSRPWFVSPSVHDAPHPASSLPAALLCAPQAAPHGTCVPSNCWHPAPMPVLCNPASMSLFHHATIGTAAAARGCRRAAAGAQPHATAEPEARLQARQGTAGGAGEVGPAADQQHALFQAAATHAASC